MTDAVKVPRAGDLMNLAGRRVLVTGASGNIGQAIALRLAEAGAQIIVHFSADHAAAAKLVSTIEALDGMAVAIAADLRAEENVERLFAEIETHGLRVDDVVNNAAIQPVEPLADISHSAWRDVMAANLDSAFMVTQVAARSLRERQAAGAIVNIASIEAVDPAPGHAHYASGKAALLMFTRAAALEYGKNGIRINAVSPGLIDREGLRDAWPEGVARWEAKAPLQRLGAAADVADAVLFLLSPAARWISGANLVVDGGMSTVSRW